MPLPIENPVALAINTTRMFFASTCPIFGLFFSCKNIMLTSCGCIYHPFCICVYLASKATKCATLGCYQTFTQEWFTNWGFNQINVLLNILKIEWTNKSLTSIVANFLKTLPPMSNCKFFLESFLKRFASSLEPVVSKLQVGCPSPLESQLC